MSAGGDRGRGEGSGPGYGPVSEERAKSIFLAARELPPDEADAFLDVSCAGSGALRARVEQLLAAVREAPEFMAAPTVESTSVGDEEQAGDRVGGFRLLQKIGEGGFGAVFMADQERPVRRRVAVKIIRLGMDSKQVIARFEAERQALAMMDHPNIARVLDAGTTERGRPYFVMELVAGDPITAYCDRNRLSVEDRLRLHIQVCRAVQHAHQKGVIHRDLKPGNILVSTQDGQPFAKVIDFGIAKATAGRLTDKTLFTEHRQLLGTPEYMSPEQVEGSIDIDTRSDVYSLGVLLYELLTGSPPFDPEQLRTAALAELQRIIREVEPPTPSARLSRGAVAGSSPVGLAPGLEEIAAARRIEPARFAPLLRSGLDWIAMKALDKVRGRRYATAQDLAEDVERFLAGEPVLAVPPSPWYRISRFVRRHRVPVAATAAVAASLLLGTASTTAFWLRERVQRREADRATAREEEAKRAAQLGEYIAKLKSALVAVEAENADGASRQLAACAPELRGWEWRLVSAMATEVPVMLGTDETVVEFSPDGSLLLTQGEKSATVWDVRTARPRPPIELPVNTGGGDATLPASAGEDRWSLHFSPDGESVVGQLSGSHWVATWDVATSKRTRFQPYGQHEGKVVGSSARALRAAIKLDGGPLRIVDLSPWREVCAIPEMKDRDVKAVHFSPNAHRAFVISNDRVGQVSGQVYSLDPCLALGAGVEFGTDWPSSVQWDHDGSAVVAVPNDRRAIWRVDGATGEARCVLDLARTRVVDATTPREEAASVGSVQDWMRDGRQVWMSGVSDNGQRALVLVNQRNVKWTYVLMDLVNDRAIAVFDQPKLTDVAALRPDGRMVCLVEVGDSGEQRVAVHDAETGRRLHVLTGHSGSISQVGFAETWSVIVTSSHDCTVRFWEAGSGAPRGEPLMCWKPVQSWELSPDGVQVVVTTGIHSENRLLLTVGGPASSASGVAAFGEWHDSKSTLIGTDSKLELVTLATGKSTRLFPREEPERIIALSVAPDGRRAVAETEGDSILLLDTGAPPRRIATMSSPETAIEFPIFSPDGSFLLAGTSKGELIRWNADTGELEWRSQVAAEGWVTVDSCAPDGELVAVDCNVPDGTGACGRIVRCSDGSICGNVVGSRIDQWIPGLNALLVSRRSASHAVNVVTGRSDWRSSRYVGLLSCSPIWAWTSDVDSTRWQARGGLFLGLEPSSDGMNWTESTFDPTHEAATTGVSNRGVRIWAPRPPRRSAAPTRGEWGDELGDVPPQGSCSAVAHDPMTGRVITLHAGTGGPSDRPTGRLWGFDPLIHERLPVAQWGDEAASPQWCTDFDFKDPADRPPHIPLPLALDVQAGAHSEDGTWLAFAGPRLITVVEAKGLRARREFEHGMARPLLEAALLAEAESVSSEARTARKSTVSPGPLLAMARDGSLVACIDGERRLCAWDARTGMAVAAALALPAADQPTALAAAPDGSRVMVGFASGTVRAFAPSASGEWEPLARTQLDGTITRIAWSPVGTACAVAVDARRVVILDAGTLEESGAAWDCGAPIGAMIFVADGSRVVTAGADGFVRIWHAASGRELLSLRERGDRSQASCMILTSDGERLVVGDQDGGMRVWDAVPWERRAEEIRSRTLAE
jgi:serine/threonine protein kinase/WD40 repeat protein